MLSRYTTYIYKMTDDLRVKAKREDVSAQDGVSSLEELAGAITLANVLVQARTLQSVSRPTGSSARDLILGKAKSLGCFVYGGTIPLHQKGVFPLSGHGARVHFRDTTFSGKLTLFNVMYMPF